MIPHSKATDIAISKYLALKPHCSIIHIAGSVRREKAFSKDIEIVCIPLKEQADLFGTELVTCQGFHKALHGISEEIIKGNPNGRYMQLKLREGINLDLFMPVESDYYRQLVIRTGSASYVHLHIAGAWSKAGWCGTDQGLRRQCDCEMMLEGGKPKWKIINPRGERPPVWKSEKEFFEWLGVKYIDPRLRETSY